MSAAPISTSSKTSITPRKHIAFETQFGRAHRATGLELFACLDAYLGNYLARVRRLLVLQTERLR